MNANNELYPELGSEDSLPIESTSSKWYSIRCMVALLSMFGTAILYITRVNLNIAILAMVKAPTINNPIVPVGELLPSPLPILELIDGETNKSNKSSSINHLLTNESLLWSKGEFDWSPPEQGIILGSFFYGYIVTQVIGGRLAESYTTPTKLIFVALSTSGVINLFTPYLARASTVAFVLSRVLLGAMQGIVYPAFYCLFSRWIPINERSTFIPWLDAGITLGTILISASSGHIIVWFSKLGGWPVVFYFSGLLALLWSVFWVILVRSEPENHPWISQQELNTILHSRESECELVAAKPNWKNILTSSVFLGVLAAKICYGIVFDFVTLKIPAYLQDVVNFPVDENGNAFAFTMVGYMCTLLTGGIMADWLIDRAVMSKCQVRKFFQLISGLTMAFSLVVMPQVGDSKRANVTLLTICMLGYGFTSGGDVPIVADNSGPLSGTVFAVINTLCSISGFAVPYLVGVVIESAPSSFLLWSYLLNFNALLIVLGTVPFLYFATSELQTSWAKETESSSPYFVGKHNNDFNEKTILLEQELTPPIVVDRDNSNIGYYQTFAVRQTTNCTTNGANHH